MCVAKKTSKEDHNQQPTYEEIAHVQFHKEILMSENAAYGRKEALVSESAAYGHKEILVSENAAYSNVTHTAKNHQSNF